MTSFLTEPRYGIRYPAPGATLPDYEAYIQALADDVGTKTAGYSSGTIGAMPAAGVEGRFYRQTDSTPAGLLFFDNGTTWQQVMLAGPWLALTLVSCSAYTNTYTPAVRSNGDSVEFRGAIISTGSGINAALPGGVPLPPVSRVVGPGSSFSGTFFRPEVNSIGNLITVNDSGGAYGPPSGAIMTLTGLSYQRN